MGFGEALLRLLESLAEPLIPTSLNTACEAATSKEEGFEVSEIILPFPCADPFGGGHAEPNVGSPTAEDHSVTLLLILIICAWRPTAIRQIPTCFRERT